MPSVFFNRTAVIMYKEFDDVYNKNYLKSLIKESICNLSHLNTTEIRSTLLNIHEIVGERLPWLAHDLLLWVQEQYSTNVGRIAYSSLELAEQNLIKLILLDNLKTDNNSNSTLEINIKDIKTPTYWQPSDSYNAFIENNKQLINSVMYITSNVKPRNDIKLRKSLVDLIESSVFLHDNTSLTLVAKYLYQHEEQNDNYSVYYGLLMEMTLDFDFDFENKSNKYNLRSFSLKRGSPLEPESPFNLKRNNEDSEIEWVLRVTYDLWMFKGDDKLAHIAHTRALLLLISAIGIHESLEVSKDEDLAKLRYQYGLLIYERLNGWNSRISGNDDPVRALIPKSKGETLIPLDDELAFSLKDFSSHSATKIVDDQSFLQRLIYVLSFQNINHKITATSIVVIRITDSFSMENSTSLERYNNKEISFKLDGEKSGLLPQVWGSLLIQLNKNKKHISQKDKEYLKSINNNLFLSSVRSNNNTCYLSAKGPEYIARVIHLFSPVVSTWSEAVNGLDKNNNNEIKWTNPLSVGGSNSRAYINCNRITYNLLLNNVLGHEHKIKVGWFTKDLQSTILVRFLTLYSTNLSSPYSGWNKDCPFPEHIKNKSIQAFSKFAYRGIELQYFNQSPIFISDTAGRDPRKDRTFNSVFKKIFKTDTEILHPIVYKFILKHGRKPKINIINRLKDKKYFTILLNKINMDPLTHYNLSSEGTYTLYALKNEHSSFYKNGLEPFISVWLSWLNAPTTQPDENEVIDFLEEIYSDGVRDFFEHDKKDPTIVSTKSDKNQKFRIIKSDILASNGIIHEIEPITQ